MLDESTYYDEHDFEELQETRQFDVYTATKHETFDFVSDL